MRSGSLAKVTGSGKRRRGGGEVECLSSQGQSFFCKAILHLLGGRRRAFAMTSLFFQQNSVSLCSATFCTPRPNGPVTPGNS